MFILHRLALFLLFYSSAITATEHNPNRAFALSLKQAPLISTLQILAQQQDVNLVLDDSLKGHINLHLKQTSFEQVLQAVGKIHQLEIENFNGDYFVSPRQNSSSSSASTVETALESTLKLQTVNIPLRHAKAAELIQSLTGGNGSFLSSHGSISFDERSNSLIIQEKSENIASLRKVITSLDQPARQVLIEARIVTISDESLRELGVRWGLFEPSGQSHRIAGSLNANGFAEIDNNLNINFGSEHSNAASVSLQVAKINSRLLDLELTALERENNVNIIASPRLLTTNKRSASIKQGTEIPYVVNNSRNETQSVEFRDAVLGLDVTPHISHDNTILLDLMISQNSPGSSVAYGNQQMTTIDKQEIQTQVFARHGETIVLGGVFHDTLVNGENKVPLLGDIPGAKRLFGNESKRYAKRELVIFVTPHIVDQQQNHPHAVSGHPTRPFRYGF
ncbi:type IV pilus secretin PilQ [Pasteurellaceae bacterium USgator11]|nr:type IV pilus secretin PilQ [Pasteurellaceae bacterium USgator41]TNG95615.1 type IV pilus secretin PilQ [Pasteurellaceae bacterium UScroc12]TNH00626.1 type IV pilus secretin PilQ [Pasteurellaceae bacterium USgator11]TNH01191.1 type IV pilus secretin PilQ [Pasteurellaceae bacterium UScroc31]